MVESDALLKRFWVAQQRAELGPLVQVPLAKGAAGRLAAAFRFAERKAGNLGASLGARYASVSPHARAAAHEAGTVAANRARSSWSPNDTAGDRIRAPGARRKFEQRRAELHEQAVAAAYEAGHRDAIASHARGYAKTAGAAARVAFRASAIGAGAGALGGAVALGAGALTDKQRAQRKAAAEARWRGHASPNTISSLEVRS